MICLFLSALSAFSESDFALTVQGERVSYTEAEIYIISAEKEYKEVADYYQKYLGIDYWNLTYANGMTVSEMIKSDVFDEIKSMNLFYAMARDKGLNLTESEQEACRLDAENAYSSLSVTDAEKIDINDLAVVLQKQRLADRMYSMCLLETEIDEESVIKSVNREDYITYDIEYLFRSFDDFDSDGNCIPLTEEKIRKIERILSSAAPETPLKEITLSDSSLDIIYGETSLVSGDDTVSDQLIDAASRLSVNELSGIIKTDLGLFIVRLIDNTDTSAYDAAVANAVYQAREEAFQPDLESLIRECEYEINVSFWNTLMPGMNAHPD